MAAGGPTDHPLTDIVRFNLDELKNEAIKNGWETK